MFSVEYLPLRTSILRFWTLPTVKKSVIHRSPVKSQRKLMRNNPPSHGFPGAFHYEGKGEHTCIKHDLTPFDTDTSNWGHCLGGPPTVMTGFMNLCNYFSLSLKHVSLIQKWQLWPLHTSSGIWQHRETDCFWATSLRGTHGSIPQSWTAVTEPDLTTLTWTSSDKESCACSLQGPPCSGPESPLEPSLITLLCHTFNITDNENKNQEK